MGIIHRICIIFFIHFGCATWMPKLQFSPNFDQFHKFKSQNLENTLYSSLGEKMSRNFQWQSVASVSLTFNKKSFILYGGSEHFEKNSNSAFSKKKSAVVICEITFNEREGNFDKINCNVAATGDVNRYLGVAIRTVSVSDKKAVLVYCDPLWHVANISEPKPSGKCYLNFINEGKMEKNSSIEFCRLSSTSFLSCLGGFSIDLISTNKRQSGIQMVVGMPYLPPYGSVQIINDPFESRTTMDPRNGIGKYFNFGYAVSMTTMSSAYASSPLSDNYGPNVTNLRQDIVLTSPDNVPFSSFGLSLKNLKIADKKRHAVIVGAPFHSYKSVQNVGKTYIFCVSNANTNSKLTTELHGETKDEFFGYALENIGDINGDGNDDLAVSSPFLRDNGASGFVSIYTVTKNCEVNRKPHQILRSLQIQKMGIFGLSISGGSDFDFNSWPDLVVLNSASNSIEMYVSRTLYKARCKYTMDNNYETESLKKGEIIQIRLFMSLVDIRKSDAVNLDFLNQFSLISQVDPNYLSTENRFKLDSGKTKMQMSSGMVVITFELESLMDVKDMNLTTPITVAYRFVENCTVKECNDRIFPLIDWESCKINVPVRKYICNIHPTCDADISINLIDNETSQIIYGLDKSFSRTLTLRISNNGPTEGKDINFKIVSFQNLRIHRVKTQSEVSLQHIISENQMEATCRLYQEEIDVNSDPILIKIEVYFMDFKDTSKMKYVNNSLVVTLFSDVKDSNMTNNEAKVHYTFVYDPKIKYSGSPTKDTVVDSRNRSQLINEGQRLAIDTIGPRLSQQYVIENNGYASVTNMTIKVSIPMETKDGQRILYLFDKIRGVNKSEAIWMYIFPQISVGNTKYPCTISDKYVNPLNIIGFETHELHLRNIDIRKERDRIHLLKRRSVTSAKSSQTAPEEDNVKMIQGKMNRFAVEMIQCNRVGVNLKIPICTEMLCRVPVLPPFKQAKFQINAWLWSYTFFKKKISDIMVYTTLQTDFHDLPEGVELKWNNSQLYSQSQQFIFQNVKPNIVHFKPWWPIIVGIVIGTLILAILIVAMYKCGFFKRTKIRRRFKSMKSKKEVYRPIILHPGEIHTVSSVNSESRLISHSALIK